MEGNRTPPPKEPYGGASADEHFCHICLLLLAPHCGRKLFRRRSRFEFCVRRKSFPRPPRPEAPVGLNRVAVDPSFHPRLGPSRVVRLLRSASELRSALLGVPSLAGFESVW